MEQTLILIHCTDAVGLVSSIAHVLAGNALNITTMREYVDESTKRFFSRIVCSGKVIDAPVLTDELRKVLPKGAQVSVNPRKKKSLAILVTKEPHCLGDILVRYFFNTLDAEISCVIGNYDTLREFTERFNVPFHYVSHEGKSKDEFEKSYIGSSIATTPIMLYWLNLCVYSPLFLLHIIRARLSIFIILFYLHLWGLIPINKRIPGSKNYWSNRSFCYRRLG